MTCPCCGCSFFESEAKKTEKGTILCPNCSSELNPDGSQKDLIKYNRKASINWVADAIKYIAYITWAVGVLAVLVVYFYNKNVSILYAVIALYSVFVSGIIVYGMGEIIQLLTEIRNNRR